MGASALPRAWRRLRGRPGGLFGSAYLAIFELEDELDLVARKLLVEQLRGNPALGGVWLPRPGANVVDVRHGGWWGGSGRLPSTLARGPSQGPLLPVSCRAGPRRGGVGPLGDRGLQRAVSLVCRCSEHAGSVERVGSGGGSCSVGAVLKSLGNVHGRLSLAVCPLCPSPPTARFAHGPAPRGQPTTPPSSSGSRADAVSPACPLLESARQKPLHAAAAPPVLPGLGRLPAGPGHRTPKTPSVPDILTRIVPCSTRCPPGCASTTRPGVERERTAHHGICPS